MNPLARAFSTAAIVTTEERESILATAEIEDFDRFWNIFSTKGAERRKQHGSKGCARLPRSQR